MRIVSLVPSQTELLSDLGLDDRVVGITRFCVHPEAWRRDKTVVGGTKQLNHDSIQTLEPDLVLANKEENTPAMVEALDAIAPVYVSDVATLPEALNMIRSVGRLTGTTLRADALASEIDAAFAALPAAPPLRVAYLIWRAPYMSVGGDTFIHAMLRRAGFVNAFAGQQRYPEVTLEDLRALNLDAVLLASEPFPFARPRFADEVRKALPHTEVQVVDGEIFSWYGSRLLQAPAYFTSLRARLSDATA